MRWGKIVLPNTGNPKTQTPVDTQVNLVRLRSNTVLVRNTMGQELKE
jgi:hypothetical protein